VKEREKAQERGELTMAQRTTHEGERSTERIRLMGGRGEGERSVERIRLWEGERSTREDNGRVWFLLRT